MDNNNIYQREEVTSTLYEDSCHIIEEARTYAFRAYNYIKFYRLFPKIVDAPSQQSKKVDAECLWTYVQRVYGRTS